MQVQSLFLYTLRQHAHGKKFVGLFSIMHRVSFFFLTNTSGETGVFRPYILFVPIQESTDYLDRGTTTNFSRKGPSTIAKIKEALNFMRNQLFEVKAAHNFTVESIYLFILHSVNLIFHIFLGSIYSFL